MPHGVSAARARADALAARRARPRPSPAPVPGALPRDAEQRAAADRLRRQLFAATRRFASPKVAERAGFDLRRAHRAPGERRVMWFHSENRVWHAARNGKLQPGKPDTLIYADLPGRPLRLVGVMISMPRGAARPNARRADHALALPPRVRGGRQARPRSARRRLVPARRAARRRQRDDARLVHTRSAQRVRDPCSVAGAVRRAPAARSDVRVGRALHRDVGRYSGSQLSR